jgi:RNA polymerase sigma factor (TIGR02999 family)
MLQRINDGEKHLADELLPLIYSELRTLAKSRMVRERAGQTLQPTALVHEAYLRLLGDEDVAWDNRGHFFAAAAESMRRILIDRARRKNRINHGGELRRTTLHEDRLQIGDDDAQLLDLDRALSELEEKDEQMAAVVKLRYFAGLTVEETAAALSLSTRSINRTWVSAKAWLAAELTR